MNAATPGELLTPELRAMLDKGVSVIVSSCDLAMRPSIMRAVGSALAPDGRAVTVYLARPQSRQLLQDIATTGRLAVVFSQPSSHRTLQLKGRGARLREAQACDAPLLARYLRSMEHEVRQVGFPPEFTRIMLSHRLEDLVAVSFEPEQAFDQTPGPRAGAALPAATRGGA